MDYYNFNPDFSDLLEFGNRRFRKGFGSLGPLGAYRENCEAPSDDVRFASLNSRINNYPIYSRHKDFQHNSSASFVKKKVEIDKEDSDSSQKNKADTPQQQGEDSEKRPLIKVTVFPVNSAAREKRNHRISKNKVKNTVSNQENCIKAQKVYVVVAGTTRDKVYELKSTESDQSNVTTNNLKNESVPLEQNLKRLIDSLDMDKKKKKGKKDKGKKDDDDDYPLEASLLSALESSGSPKLSLLKECMCSAQASRGERSGDRPLGRKSRVRITGKIGLTDDDRYVLKCNATVDGQPVETSFIKGRPEDEWDGPQERLGLGNSDEPSLLDSPYGWDEDDNKCPAPGAPCQKSLGRSANVCPAPGAPCQKGLGQSSGICPAPGAPCQKGLGQSTSKCPAPGAPCEKRGFRPNRHEENWEQSFRCPAPGAPCERKKERNLFQREAFVQANMTVENKFMCPAFSSHNNDLRSVETQCDPTTISSVCFSNIDKLKIVSGNRDEMIQCNCIQDVATSFGVGGDYISEAVANKSGSNPLVIISVYPKHESASDKIPDGNSSKETPLRALKGKKGGGGKKKEGKGGRSRSPTPTKTTTKEKPEKGPKGKKGGDDKNAKGKKGGKKEKPKGMGEKSLSLSLSPDRQSLRSGQRSPQRADAGRCTDCCIGCPGNSSWKQPFQRSQTNQTNQSKRMMNWVSAKNNVSNVAISIDGEKEFYDVLLQQGDNTTDVRVRKTSFKDASDVDSTVDVESAVVESRTDSLENFFVPDGHKRRKRSFSQTFLLDDPANAESALEKEAKRSTLRLQVRDSIELSHRREEKESCNSLKVPSGSSSSSSEDNIRFAITAPAPAKHYHGDNCDLPNPVQRDKEIRELLGIEKRGSKTSQKFPYPAKKTSMQCLFYNKRNDGSSTVMDFDTGTRMPFDTPPTSATQSEKLEVPATHKQPPDTWPNDQELRSCMVFTDRTTKGPHDLKTNFKSVFTEEPSRDTQTSISTQTQISEYFQRPTLDDKLCQTDCVEFKEKRSIDTCCEHSYCELIKDAQNQMVGALKYHLTDFYEPLTEEESIFCTLPIISSREIYKQSPVNYIPQKPFPWNQSSESNWPECSVFINRNVNVFVQFEQLSDKRPIVLSRKQYAKVKRTIEETGSKKRCSVFKKSSISVGEVKPAQASKHKAPVNNVKRSINKGIQCGCDGINLQPNRVLIEQQHFMQNRPPKQELVKHTRPHFELKPRIIEMRDIETQQQEHQFDHERRQMRGADGKGTVMQHPTHEFDSNKLVHREKEKKDNMTQHEYDRNAGLKQEHVEKNTTMQTQVTPMEHKQINKGLEKKDLSALHSHKHTEYNKGVEENITQLLNNQFDHRREPKYDEIKDLTAQNQSNRRSHKEQLKIVVQRKEISAMQEQNNKHQRDEQLEHDEQLKKEIEEIIVQLKNKKYELEQESKLKRPNQRGGTAKPHSNQQREHVELLQKEMEEVITQLQYGYDAHLNRHLEIKTKQTEAYKTERSKKEKETKAIKSNRNKNRGDEKRTKQKDLVIPRNPPFVYGPTARQRDSYVRCRKCNRPTKCRTRICSICKELTRNSEPDVSEKNVRFFRHVSSSTEVRCTYKKSTIISNHALEMQLQEVPVSEICLDDAHNSNSLFTIFKGYKNKTSSQNLSVGTIYSKYTDAESKSRQDIQALQPRKPFLRRLMSCLVMRSRASEVKVDKPDLAKLPNLHPKISSSDCYHINSSLEGPQQAEGSHDVIPKSDKGIELSSSIYDTSDSFYSNHSIHQINNKMKRGFLSSVRGFLNRRH